MGRFATCIKMLQRLSTGEVVKMSDLAEYLGDDGKPLNLKTVVEYRKQLELAGYDISTIPGPNGGYHLDYNDGGFLPMLKLLPSEKDALVDAYNYLLSKNDFVNRNGFIDAAGKLFAQLMLAPKDGSVHSENTVKTKLEYESIDAMYKKIDKAIKEQRAIVLHYNFLRGDPADVVIHPYELFLYDNEWRVFGLRTDTGEDWPFKLSRIVSIKYLDKHFNDNCGFRIEKYIKDGVFVKNGKMFELVLTASNERAHLFREKVYGKDQVVEELPDGSVRVRMKMQENNTTYNFILGCGDLVTVESPEWLKEKVHNRAVNIVKKYEK